MKIVTIVGARPQFVKAAVVSRALRGSKCDVNEVVVHTGQHYDKNMSEIFFQQLDICRPDYNLGIGGGTHGQNTGRMLEAIEATLLKEDPDLMLVYGDTDSTLAGALAAVKLHVPVAHVEAGLRSFNRHMPEEVNRILTDHASDRLFAPTCTAMANLAKEGISESKAFHVGDVMYDASLFYRKNAERPKGLDLDRGFILATIHRAENTDTVQRFDSILKGLEILGENHPVVFPLHPRARNLLESRKCVTKNIMFIDPVGYLQMIWMLEHCELVITDSGGLQKEAFFFGKRCLTTRLETEWIELIESGVNKLVGYDVESIVGAGLQAMSEKFKSGNNPFGEGNAGELIAGSLTKSF